MMQTLLVPLDGSAEAEQALPVAERLAQPSRAQLILLRAVPAHHRFAPHATSAEIDEAERYLAELQARIDGSVPTSTTTFCGDPDDAIVEEIGLRDVDLVIMATHARKGLPRLLHGSVAAAVVARATVPVLVVPTGSKRDGNGQSRVPMVLVPLDGSAFSERALPIATEIARLLSARVDLIEAVPVPEYPAVDLTGLGVAYVEVDLEQMQADAQRYLTSVAEEVPQTNGSRPVRISLSSDVPDGVARDDVRARRAEFVVDWQPMPAGDTSESAPSISTRVAAPAVAIAEEARARHADLVVMATHGRRGLARLIKGSVAEAVYSKSSGPCCWCRRVCLRFGQRCRHRRGSPDKFVRGCPNSAVTAARL